MVRVVLLDVVLARCAAELLSYKAPSHGDSCGFRRSAVPHVKDLSGRVNEADRLFHTTRYVTAFLRQTLEPFVSGQRDIKQRRLPSDYREITGR